MSELDSYDYDLPRHLIAQSPAICRTDARLLVVDADGVNALAGDPAKRPSATDFAGRLGVSRQNLSAPTATPINMDMPLNAPLL